MAIRKMRISNFKSYKDLEIELGKFSVLIGANASGKSNFIQVFRFLRDITYYGLDNAISLQGGIEFLRNASIGSSNNFSLKTVSDEEFRFPIFTRRKRERRLWARTNEVIYEFAIEFKERGKGFTVSEDKLTLKCRFFEYVMPKRKREEKELGSGDIILYHSAGTVKYDLNLFGEAQINKDDILPPFWGESKLSSRTPLIERAFFLFIPVEDIFADIAIYDFDPNGPKRAFRGIGKMELEEDGSNLVFVLKNIGRDPRKRRKFSNLIRDLLPFIEDWRVKELATDKSLLFTLRETYSPGFDLPAFSISDGTINITALIAALYFEEKSLIVIEEPERNIHPFLISKVVDMLKEASDKKQIFVTTHNPEMVKHADLEDIMLVSRDSEGFSTISRPSGKEEVKIFLENEMGIEELYVQNLLGI